MSSPCGICGYGQVQKALPDFTVSLQDLMSSGQLGCPICELFALTIDENTKPCVEKLDEVRWVSRERHLLKTPNAGLGRSYEIFMTPESSNPLPEIINTASILAEDTGLINSPPQVEAWLDRCTVLHPHCDRPGYVKKGRSVPIPTLPYRILDIGESSVSMVKLVEPSSWSNSERYSEYVCLSYCWGNFLPECITTKASYDENMRGISSQKLPRTFSDAVSLCRAIGFRYLWVDSCCIIQDDLSDWNARAPEMYGIYKNATLTVAATASKSGEGGCFQKLDGKYRERPLHLSTHSREKLGLAAEAELWTRLVFPHDLSDMPLLRRGWVYQERLLSPRIVHFTANELMWECHGEILCSCSENGVFPAPEDPRYGPRLKEKHFWAMGPLKSSFLIRGSLQKRWYEMVQEYTSLALSFGKDKLPALAGLAKEMEINLRKSSASLRHIDTLYIDGLWRDTFLDDMIWFVDDPGTIQRMPLQWRSPSWSWASVDSPISYPQRLSIAEKFLPHSELALSAGLPTSTYAVLTGQAAVAVLACENETSAAGISAYVVKISRQPLPVFLDYHRFGPRSMAGIDLYGNAYCLELGSFAGSGIRYFLLLARTQNLKPDSWSNEDLDSELELWRYRSNSEPRLARRIGLAVVGPNDDFLQSFQQSCCQETFIVV